LSRIDATAALSGDAGAPSASDGERNSVEAAASNRMFFFMLGRLNRIAGICNPTLRRNAQIAREAAKSKVMQHRN
jgi:hypothetical protein